MLYAVLLFDFLPGWICSVQVDEAHLISMQTGRVVAQFVDFSLSSTVSGFLSFFLFNLMI